MKIPNKEERKKFDEESDKTLATAISEAVEKAMSLCEQGQIEGTNPKGTRSGRVIRVRE